MEWMDEVKFSPTPSPELHEEYQARRDDEEVERNARRGPHPLASDADRECLSQTRQVHQCQLIIGNYNK
jgi:hypothetical protein